MKIKQVEIQNFRSIKYVRINLLPYMVFVGKNNSGKSNLMVALSAFFSCEVGHDDFRKKKGKKSKILSVTVQFYKLNKNEQIIYAGKLKKNGEKDQLLVLRMKAESPKEGKIKPVYEYLSESLNLDNPQAKTRYGPLYEESTYKSVPKILEHPHIPQEFKTEVEGFVATKGQKRLTKQEYIDLRDKFVKDLLKKYPSLTKESFEEIKINSRNCAAMLGNFFFIPAVQDVEDETKYTAKGNKSLNHLMNYVLDQMQDLESRTIKEREIRGLLTELYHLEEKGSEINNLRGLLNEQLALFDNSELSFDTKLPNLSKMIRDSLKIYIDDGIKTEVQYKGHGLQRYFMVVLLKAWSEKLKEQKKQKKEACTSTYFSIEEPELFLHPQFQRMMRIYLQKIADDEEHQIILNTHSPHFIEFNDIFQVAKVIKTNEQTTIIQPLEFNDKGGVLKKEMVCTWGDPSQKQKYRAINRVNMNYFLNPERNELFFADKVVLVEGQTEKMLFQAWANHFYNDNIALLSQVTYIDCVGKFNFEQFTKILGEFKIPFVAVYDTDSNNPKFDQNKNIYIKRSVKNNGGVFFELEPDFEGEFQITEEERDSRGQKKHKPYYAFTQFFEVDGTPKEEQLKFIKAHPKLHLMFKEIYGIAPFNH